MNDTIIKETAAKEPAMKDVTIYENCGKRAGDE